MTGTFISIAMLAIALFGSVGGYAAYHMKLNSKVDVVIANLVSHKETDTSRLDRIEKAIERNTTAIGALTVNTAKTYTRLDAFIEQSTHE